VLRTLRIAFDADLANIERIEVLYGPQSTLYAATTMGGLLKFVTQQPSLTEYSGSVRVNGTQVHDGGAGYGLRGTADLPLEGSTRTSGISTPRRSEAQMPMGTS
jgi:outer membrane receptor protein involved in Fe transport